MDRIEHLRVTCPKCGSERIGHSARYIVRNPVLGWERGEDGVTPTPTSFDGDDLLSDTCEALDFPFECLDCGEVELTEDDLVVTARAGPGRTGPEPLTIAYIAMGAHEAIREHPEGCLPDAVADAYSGQLGFIDACIDHALMLDRAWDSTGGGNATFAYDVAEPFGEAIATDLIACAVNGTTPVNPTILAETIIRRADPTTKEPRA